MGRRKGWQRTLGRMISINRPLDICICRCKRNLDEVAKILCDSEKGGKWNPIRKNKKS